MPALTDVTFTIARGECVAILGQNGSGKSTLVRLLSTLLLDDGGEARIFGYDAFRETRAIRRLVNRVSVEASFFKKMSAQENLSYAARKAQAKRAVREQQAASGAALAALQGRIMADPALVERLVAIKAQLNPDEIETLMGAIATSPDEDRTKFLESVKALPVDGGVAFCRDVAATIRESSAAFES